MKLVQTLLKHRRSPPWFNAILGGLVVSGYLLLFVKGYPPLVHRPLVSLPVHIDPEVQIDMDAAEAWRTAVER